ncbi:MAG: pyridoxamine 5'-phosphate oxidase family protein [Bacilli bacterium]
MNLFDYTELINDKPIHIATINSNNNPNLCVASDVRVIDKNKIIISVNEMNNTQKNIQYNDNVVITAFNNDWVGLRLYGKAIFYNDGEYYDFCKNTFFSNNEVTPFGATKPKGAIVVTLDKIEDYK